MANRVTATEVKVIINTDLADAVITTHIGIANELVTSLLGSSGLSSTRLKNIELYLSAHFVGIGRDKEEGQMISQAAGTDGRIEYNRALGESLKATFFGQQALVLDTTGVLINLGVRRAQFRVI